jgi:AcrR family transcriptional regulator
LAKARSSERERAQVRGAAAPEADGRVRRGERNRDAIIEAMFALVGEGVLQPTAEQVARRAGVGLRSVFRHFRDMESLYAALDGRLRADVEPLAADAPPSGGRAVRARAMVQLRARLFERIAPYKRSANLMRQRSPFLEAQHRSLVSALRGHLLRCLPELSAAPRELFDAVDLATSFEAWDRLRSDQKLSVARARTAVEASVAALLRLR